MEDILPCPLPNPVPHAEDGRFETPSRERLIIRGMNQKFTLMKKLELPERLSFPYDAVIQRSSPTFFREHTQ